MSAFPEMLEHDRKRSGLSVAQVAWQIGVSPMEYPELEAGGRFPAFDTWGRMCKLFGWPQTFVGRVPATRAD